MKRLLKKYVNKGDFNLKYGLLVFKETDNIGDDIQAYAAERFYLKLIII